MIASTGVRSKFLVRATMNKSESSDRQLETRPTITDTLTSLLKLTEYARNQASENELKFIAYLLDMARIAINDELNKS